MQSKQAWRATHRIYLRALQKPTDLQRRLLELDAIEIRGSKEERELELLWNSEQQKARADAAEIRARRAVQKRGSGARTMRARRLIEYGALVEIARMDGDRGVLLGALIELEKQLQAAGGDELARRYKKVGDC
jgi:hypothetical protein